jgi:hypothetical protein
MSRLSGFTHVVNNVFATPAGNDSLISCEKCGMPALSGAGGVKGMT